MAASGAASDPIHVQVDSGGTGSLGAVTVADGADVAQGTTTDDASANTVVGLLKNLKAALAGTLTAGLAAGTNAIGKVGHDTTGIGTVRQAVTTAGTRVQLSSQAAKWALVQCAPANTQGIAVGDVNVVAASGTVRGTYLGVGDPPCLIPVTNLNLLYIDSRVNGEAATITYGT
jgi:hypothetical protein